MRGLKQTKKLAIGALLLLIIFSSGAVGWLAADKREFTQEHTYPLLDPSVSDPTVHPEIINFDPLRQNLKKYLAGLNVSHSLYFEYLTNGVNIRDGADSAAIAASLMKTPIIMDLYKLAEDGKLNINSTVTIQSKDISNDADYGDPTNLKAGDSLTLADAAKITLYDSDNTTLNAIKDKVIPLLDNNSDSIQSLDISYNLIGSNFGDEQVTISSRSYASVLKCLYYACFNNPVDSTQILNDLSGSVERNRLMAGVPKGVQVAHKVGSSPTGQSDCGIIYYPGKPYLVCLMFFNQTGDNLNNVDQYFQHVSKMIYDYISKTGGQS